MRQVILGARIADSRVKSGEVPFPARPKRPAALLWFTVTLVVMCLVDAPGSGAHAQSNGINSQQLAQASVALAETYDPQTLSNGGTYGMRGDATRARDLSAKDEVGGSGSSIFARTSAPMSIAQGS